MGPVQSLFFELTLEVHGHSFHLCSLALLYSDSQNCPNVLHFVTVH